MSLNRENVDPTGDSSTGRVSLRFTWYTVGLVGFFILMALLEHYIPQQNPLPFGIGLKLADVVVMWIFFFVAYKGIRASGNCFADAVGKPWSSLPELWKDLKLSLAVVLLIYLATVSLTYLGPFKAALMGPARTGPQYLVTLLVAVSAGFTEEVIFRGLILSQFRLLMGNVPAAIIAQSLVFGLAHGGNQSVTQFLKHSFSGSLFACLVTSRNSLWPAILAHVLLDVTVFTVQFLAR